MFNVTPNLVCKAGDEVGNRWNIAAGLISRAWKVGLEIQSRLCGYAAFRV